ncbi:Protein kinase domain-containing protein, partial [Streptomyces sp. Ncost-T6T-2b]
PGAPRSEARQHHHGGGRPRVLDFGIARALESTRLTATGTAFGTPGFLAPEQAQGQEVDGAADVFALGAVLVAAAGGSAFGAGTPMGLMYRSVHEPPDLAAVPEGLRPVLAACLAKAPEDRPAPAGLLDLFVPDAAPSPPAAAYAPTVAVVAPPPPSYAPHNAFQPPHQQQQQQQYYQHQYQYPVPPNSPLPYAAPTWPVAAGGAPDDDADLSFVAVGPGSSLLIDADGVTLGPEGAETQYTWAEIRTVAYAAEGPKRPRGRRPPAPRHGPPVRHHRPQEVPPPGVAAGPAADPGVLPLAE